MPLPTIADLEKGKENLDAFDAVINSDEGTTVETPDGGFVDSLAKAIATIKAFNDRGDWTQNTAYAVKDLVVDPDDVNEAVYVRVTPGTSPASGTFQDEYDAGNGPWRLYQDIQGGGGGAVFGTAGGTADAITLTVSPSALGYTNGDEYSFISTGANTGAVTLNVSGLGVKSVTKHGTTALAAGDIPSGAMVHVQYDGTRFQLLNVSFATLPKLGSNNAFTGNNTFAGTSEFQAAVALVAAALNEANRVDLASATTPNLDTVLSNYVRITGTTTITGFTLTNGRRRHLLFAGILTLTNGANLILPSGANITTAAGDTCIAMGEAGGVVRIVEYTKANGKALVETAQSSGSLILIETKEASSSSSLDFTNGIDGTYDEYLFVLSGIRPATNNVRLDMRVSVDGGSNYLTTNVYDYAGESITVGATVATVASSAIGQIALSAGVGLSNTSTESLSGEVRMFKPSSTSLKKRFLMESMFSNSTPTPMHFKGGGTFQTSGSAVNAVRFIHGSGNMAVGTISLYGVKKT